MCTQLSLSALLCARSHTKIAIRESDNCADTVQGAIFKKKNNAAKDGFGLTVRCVAGEVLRHSEVEKLSVLSDFPAHAVRAAGLTAFPSLAQFVSFLESSQIAVQGWFFRVLANCVVIYSGFKRGSSPLSDYDAGANYMGNPIVTEDFYRHVIMKGRTVECASLFSGSCRCVRRVDPTSGLVASAKVVVENGVCHFVAGLSGNVMSVTFEQYYGAMMAVLAFPGLDYSAGCCYLRGFPASVRWRVYCELGKYPSTACVADQLRKYEAVWQPAVKCDVDMHPGLLHVATEGSLILPQLSAVVGGESINSPADPRDAIAHDLLDAMLSKVEAMQLTGEVTSFAIKSIAAREGCGRVTTAKNDKVEGLSSPVVSPARNAGIHLTSHDKDNFDCGIDFGGFSSGEDNVEKVEHLVVGGKPSGVPENVENLRPALRTAASLERDLKRSASVKFGETTTVGKGATPWRNENERRVDRRREISMAKGLSEAKYIDPDYYRRWCGRWKEGCARPSLSVMPRALRTFSIPKAVSQDTGKSVVTIASRDADLSVGGWTPYKLSVNADYPSGYFFPKGTLLMFKGGGVLRWKNFSVPLDRTVIQLLGDAKFPFSLVGDVRIAMWVPAVDAVPRPSLRAARWAMLKLDVPILHSRVPANARVLSGVKKKLREDGLCTFWRSLVDGDYKARFVTDVAGEMVWLRFRSRADMRLEIGECVVSGNAIELLVVGNRSFNLRSERRVTVRQTDIDDEYDFDNSYDSCNSMSVYDLNEEIHSGEE